MSNLVTSTISSTCPSNVHELEVHKAVDKNPTERLNISHLFILFLQQNNNMRRVLYDPLRKSYGRILAFSLSKASAIEFITEYFLRSPRILCSCNQVIEKLVPSIALASIRLHDKGNESSIMKLSDIPKLVCLLPFCSCPRLHQLSFVSRLC